MATRHQVRQAVVSLLYAYEMGTNNDEFVAEFLEERKIRNERKNLAMTEFDGVITNLEKIDESIKEMLKDQDFLQLGKIELSILRLGVYELICGKVDTAVIINEAVELAKELGSESSPKFINGVLDAFKDKI